MKKRSAVTQKQIAEHAGVSQTLVSLVMNHSYDVTLNEETRQRVLAVANDLGYVPQAAATALVKGRNSNLGLVLVQPHYQIFRDPYIPNIMTGLGEVTRAQGFRLLVEHINNLNQKDTIRRMLKGGEVAGIVLSGVHGVEPFIHTLLEEGYPIVALDKFDVNAHYAIIDHVHGVQLAADYLLSQGHRQIGCIPFGPPTEHNNRRLNAFLATLARGGVALPPQAIQQGHYDPETGYKAMQTLLEQVPGLTAVFGMNDMMALGAMRAIHDAGLHIPDAITVMGYDDMRFAAYTYPALTTVRSPEIELGRAAGEMLIRLISGESGAIDSVILRPQLIVRGSSAAV